MGTKGVFKPVEVRFWAKVDKTSHPDGCWIWTGSRVEHGYGRISVEGRRRPAHQVSWELRHKKPFPAGKMACHTCDNPPCVNPLHIWPGSMSDNINDAWQKGRQTYKGNQNSEKATCLNGHLLEGDNLWLKTFPAGNIGRVCLTCKRERDRRARAVRRKPPTEIATPAHEPALMAGIARLGSMEAFTVSGTISSVLGEELLARINFARALLNGASHGK